VKWQLSELFQDVTMLLPFEKVVVVFSKACAMSVAH